MTFMTYVDKTHVKAWLAEHDASVKDASEAAAFAAALDQLPWLGSAPDWSASGMVKLTLDSPDFWHEFTKTDFACFDDAFLMYAPAEPGIVAPVRDIVEGLDVLTWKAPGFRFLCAVVGLGHGWRIEPEVFAAYDGADHLLLRSNRRIS